MTFTLKSLPKFKKKTAKKINNFKKFKPDKDQLLIDDAFSGDGEQSITFADTKAEAKKALKSPFQWIYYKKSGLLIFNKNGSKPGTGSGGVAAVFKKKTPLDQSNFDFSSNQQSSSSSTTEPSGNRGSYTARLKEAGDVDFFPFEVGADAIASFSVDAPDKWPMIDIINQNGDIISKKNGFDSNQAYLQPYENRAGSQELRLKISSQTEQTGDYIIEYNIQSFSDIKEEVVNLTNKERSKSGLSPLTRNPLLDKAAQRHAEDMDASGKYLAHIGSDGSTAEQRIKAAGYKAGWYDNGSGSLSYPRQENVAYGQDTAEEVVEGWMNSPGHRAAILAKDAKEIGVGLEIDNALGDAYWVQTFGNPFTTGSKAYF